VGGPGLGFPPESAGFPPEFWISAGIRRNLVRLGLWRFGRMLESSFAVFAALEGKPARGESPTDDEGPEAALKSPDGWAAFASGLAARSQSSQMDQSPRRTKALDGPRP
jgi:hypothetical protein